MNKYDAFFLGWLHGYLSRALPPFPAQVRMEAALRPYVELNRLVIQLLEQGLLTDEMRLHIRKVTRRVHYPQGAFLKEFESPLPYELQLSCYRGRLCGYEGGEYPVTYNPFTITYF